VTAGSVVPRRRESEWKTCVRIILEAGVHKEGFELQEGEDNIRTMMASGNSFFRNFLLEAVACGFTPCKRNKT
jgi:hypothetical protein